MTNRMRDAWQQLVDAFGEQVTKGADPAELEMWRHLFIAGAIAYRDLLQQTLADNADDLTGLMDLKALDRELDALAAELRIELAGLQVKH